MSARKRKISILKIQFKPFFLINQDWLIRKKHKCPHLHGFPLHIALRLYRQALALQQHFLPKEKKPKTFIWHKNLKIDSFTIIDINKLVQVSLPCPSKPPVACRVTRKIFWEKCISSRYLVFNFSSLDTLHNFLGVLCIYFLYISLSCAFFF